MSDPAAEPKPSNLSERLTALKMHVDMANGEKQAIWTRHATMLVGNSIIVAAARSPPIDPHTAQFLNIIGLLLCIAWAVMTWVGWDWFHKSLRAGASVQIEPLSNPFTEFQLANPTRCRDPIFIVAMLVVGLFALLYLNGLGVGLRLNGV
jgi:hypothetical protein